MPVFVRASSRARAYVRGGSSGKLRRYRFSRQSVRGTSGITATDQYHKQEINRPGASRTTKRKHVKYLRAFRHGK